MQGASPGTGGGASRIAGEEGVGESVQLLGRGRAVVLGCREGVGVGGGMGALTFRAGRLAVVERMRGELDGCSKRVLARRSLMARRRGLLDWVLGLLDGQLRQAETEAVSDVEAFLQVHASNVVGNTLAHVRERAVGSAMDLWVVGQAVGGLELALARTTAAGWSWWTDLIAPGISDGLARTDNVALDRLGNDVDEDLAESRRVRAEEIQSLSLEIEVARLYDVGFLVELEIQARGRIRTVAKPMRQAVEDPFELAPLL